MRPNVLMVLAILVAGTPLLYGQDPAQKQNVETFMRAKLVHSQNVLEGLTTDDLEMVAKNAQEMSLLSLASTWQVIETPEYARRSSEFRRAVDDMRKAAREDNLDGATLSFVSVTMKCVECHKYVRSVRHAKVQLPKEFKPLPTR